LALYQNSSKFPGLSKQNAKETTGAKKEEVKAVP
jgi:hypothetical protein